MNHPSVMIDAPASVPPLQPPPSGTPSPPPDPNHPRLHQHQLPTHNQHTQTQHAPGTSPSSTASSSAPSVSASAARWRSSTPRTSCSTWRGAARRFFATISFQRRRWSESDQIRRSSPSSYASVSGGNVSEWVGGRVGEEDGPASEPSMSSRLRPLTRTLGRASAKVWSTNYTKRSDSAQCGKGINNPAHGSQMCEECLPLGRPSSCLQLFVQLRDCNSKIVGFDALPVLYAVHRYARQLFAVVVVHGGRQG